MPISIEADPTLAQGYLKVNGVTAATVTSTGITASSLVQKYTLDTAKASTSGTSIDFTGIPSWAKRITVMFGGVSTNGAAHILIQLSTGAVFASSGYASSMQVVQGGAGSSAASSTAGFIVSQGAASVVTTGTYTLSNRGTNGWIGTGVFAYEHAVVGAYGAGRVTLGGSLDGIRITTVNGTDTFDAGTINIAYEG